jgi:hypothetical protein
MPISSESNQTSVVLTGSGQTIPIAFVFYDATDLVVRSLVSGGTATTLLVEGVDYSVAGGDGASGSVIMTAGASGDTITVYREVPYTQTLDLEENDPMPSSSLELALDRLAVQILQLKAQLDRCLRLSQTSTEQPAVELLDRASKFLGFNGAGELTALDASALISVLNLSETTIDRPLKTWTDSAARLLAVPDFTGQVGVETDDLDSANIGQSLWVSYGTGAGEWRQFTADIADAATHSGVAATTKILVDDGGVNASATVADLLALTPTVLESQIFS